MSTEITISDKDLRKNCWYKAWKKERKFMPDFPKSKVFKDKNTYSRKTKHKNREED